MSTENPSHCSSHFGQNRLIVNQSSPESCTKSTGNFQRVNEDHPLARVNTEEFQAEASRLLSDLELAEGSLESLSLAFTEH
jgi:hypothetical protein